MKSTLILSVFVFIVLFGCSPAYEVFSDYDKQADIADYSTYRWLSQQAIEEKGLNPLYYNELNDKRIKDAVDKQLRAKGFIFINGTVPLEVHYHIVVEQKALAIAEPVGFNYGNYWLSKATTTYPYKQGTLIVDLMDSKKKQLVWRGWVTSAIEPSIRRDPEEGIQKAVEKIFEHFPYRR